MLTGFFGETLFGSHLVKSNKDISSVNELTENIIDFYDEVSANRIVKELVINFDNDKIKNHLKKIFKNQKINIISKKKKNLIL